VFPVTATLDTMLTGEFRSKGPDLYKSTSQWITTYHNNNNHIILVMREDVYLPARSYALWWRCRTQGYHIIRRMAA
jgi:hypothetical protein